MKSCNRPVKGRNAGISRMALIMVILVIVMAVVIAVPKIRAFNAGGEEVACAVGLDSARRRLAEDVIVNQGKEDARQAQEVVTVAMNGWDDLCPGGGKVYLVRTQDRNLPYDLVCGKHDSDTKRRTRLNAGYVLTQIDDKLAMRRLVEDEFPQTLTFNLNGEEWEAVLTDEPVTFKRGTATTKGYEKKKNVAYYGIMGHSEFGSDTGAEEGELCYFVFADPEHYAEWDPDEGWTGDCYG